MKWIKREYDKSIKDDLVKNGIGELLSILLSQRNIGVESAKKFLFSAYKDLSHPYSLKGVKEAAELFCNKIIKNKQTTVGICSDYDLDGVCSAVMIRELCDTFGLQCKVFLPDRMKHGYGLNDKSIRDIKKTFDVPPDILFITDCGTNSESEILNLKKWAPLMTIIIIDHHPIDLHKISKSADVLINWHNCDFEETCACGEVYHFIRGIRWLTKKVNPIEFLTYASMGILADVSPIIGDNRVIIKNGLKQFALSHVTGAGLNALLRKSRIYTSNVSQEDILFKIAPKINAAGRLAHPDIAFKLLIEQDVSKCEDMAENLTEYNDKRKDIQKKMEDEAVAMVNANKDKFKHGILLYSPNWLTGVVGIVASKMVEKFHVPAILIGQNDGMLKGSGRSLENINLKQIMDDCNEIFEHYGGHPLAAGASLKKEHINDANDKFNEACERYYKIHGYPRSIRYYDYELLPKHITPKATKKLLETMYPYCEHFNPEPVFLLKDVTLVNVGMREDKNKAWRIISFNVEKDGIKSMIKMKMFNNTLGTEIEGLKADIYFSFPQSIERNDFGYDPTINVLDIVMKKG